MFAEIVKWLAYAIASAFGAFLVAFYACRLFGVTGRAFRNAGVAVALVAVVAIFRGGAKPLNLQSRFTADTGLAVVTAVMDRATNETDNTTLAVSWTGGDTSAPVSVRETVHEPWTPLLSTADGWTFDGATTAGGTNSAAWHIAAGVAASNATVWAKWHLGTDLPPVEIDGDGVTIEDFQCTSKAATLSYAVNPTALGSGGGAVTVDVQRGNGGAWAEIYRLPISAPVTNTVQFSGFWIGETTRWRVRLEVQ